MHRDALRRGFHLMPNALENQIRAGARDALRAARGLFRRDPSTWSHEPSVQKAIANRLGWLDALRLMSDGAGRLLAVAEEVKQSGIEHLVLLGMGGSSLAPEVLRAAIGSTRGWPRLHMLDSTDPAAVRAVATNVRTTVYLLASKSGTTIEPNSLAAHFVERLQAHGVSRWAGHFIAITDEGTALATRARTEGFREVFINPSDIGGRYSALSYFGLVPAALMGQNVAEILRWGTAMLDEAHASLDDDDPETITRNPAVALGLLMAAGASAGRDKLTLVVPAALESFGLWVEQLVAESTGKQGVGVVPVAGETLGEPSVYGDDRAFVRLRATSDRDEERRDRAMRALAPAPVASVDFDAPEALGAEFVRWEVATAVAGAMLQINPFDEPNVQQAKDATRVLLDRHAAEGRLPVARADHTSTDGVAWTLTPAAREALAGGDPLGFLTVLGQGDYLALLAYLGPAPGLATVLHRFRMTVRDRACVATMSGYGPRYLHSTGQLHKGGPNTGVFVLITAEPAEDLPIPGAGYSFATLEHAQALGDFASLQAEGRRGLHLHLPLPDPALLESALALLMSALP
jgi:glucose-6-phosphate isomerase